MEVFRIAIEPHCYQLVSSGRAARWNRDGEFVLYTSTSRSLASLELVVHNMNLVSPSRYRVMMISIADDDRLFKQINAASLDADWRSMLSYPELRKAGSAWYHAKESLVLKVPSAVIQYEHNFLINTNHSDFKNHVQLVRTEEFFWDERIGKSF